MLDDGQTLKLCKGRFLLKETLDATTQPPLVFVGNLRNLPNFPCLLVPLVVESGWLPPQAVQPRFQLYVASRVGFLPILDILHRLSVILWEPLFLEESLPFKASGGKLPIELVGLLRGILNGLYWDFWHSAPKGLYTFLFFLGQFLNQGFHFRNVHFPPALLLKHCTVHLKG